MEMVCLFIRFSLFKIVVLQKIRKTKDANHIWGHLLEIRAIIFFKQGRTQGGVGVKNPLSLIFYKNFTAWTKKIDCFRILLAC